MDRWGMDLGMDRFSIRPRSGVGMSAAGDGVTESVGEAEEDRLMTETCFEGVVGRGTRGGVAIGLSGSARGKERENASGSSGKESGRKRGSMRGNARPRDARDLRSTDEMTIDAQNGRIAMREREPRSASIERIKLRKPTRNRLLPQARCRLPLRRSLRLPQSPL